MNLNSVMISSGEPAKLIDFYARVIEADEPEFEDKESGFTGWQVGDGFLVIGPHDEVSGQSKEPQRVMLSLEVDDVEGEFERLKGLGAQVVAEPYHPGPSPDMTIATLADPDGNYFQLMSPM